jgi:hypothetical protein
MGFGFMKPVIFKTKQEILSDIFSLVLKYNRDDFHIFVRYYGHVDKIEISCCPGGWRSVGGNIIVLENYIKNITQGDFQKSMSYINFLSQRNADIAPFVSLFNGIRTVQ